MWLLLRTKQPDIMFLDISIVKDSGLTTLPLIKEKY